MKESKDECHTPFATKPFHRPAFLDEESKIPRVPTKDEYFEWIRGECLKVYQKARNDWMIKNKYSVRYSSLLLCENLDHIYHICVEGLFETQKKRERLDPEVLYIGVQMGRSIENSTRRDSLMWSMGSSGTECIGTL